MLIAQKIPNNLVDVTWYIASKIFYTTHKILEDFNI